MGTIDPLVIVRNNTPRLITSERDYLNVVRTRNSAHVFRTCLRTDLIAVESIFEFDGFFGLDICRVVLYLGFGIVTLHAKFSSQGTIQNGPD